MLRIGCEKNKDIGLVGTIYIQIGFEVNKDIGQVGTINYQTPTDNPQSTSQRTQRKNKRGNTAQPRIDSTRINSDQILYSRFTPYNEERYDRTNQRLKQKHDITTIGGGVVDK